MRRFLQHTSLALIAIVGLITANAEAGPLADVIGYVEVGQNATGGLDWADPDNVLVKAGGISLGNYDDATYLPPIVEDTVGYNMNQGNPPGMVVGFTTPVNNGPGNDLRIQGNAYAIDGTDYYWSEPGYIEVAAETTPGQTGATTDGWADETFYLIKPSNYDQVGDPRLGPLSGIYVYGDDPDGALDDNGHPLQVQKYADSWGEDLIDAGGSQLDLYGWADWNPSGDRVDLSDAIDMDGNPVALASIAYVRIRTASNEDMGIFGSMSTEVEYVEDISMVPEPTSLALLAAGGAALIARRRRR